MIMKQVVWILVVALALLHHDFWWWSSTDLVFGFIPVGLAYQSAFSVAAALVWFLAVRFAWPTHIERWADEFEGIDPEAGAHGEGDSE